VVAPIGTHVAPLLESLRSSRFEPFFVSDFLTSRSKAVSQVRTAFKSVDFVVGLLPAGRPLESTFFELGIALGLARPIIIFADVGVRIDDLFGAIEIQRADLSQPTGLISSIERFLIPKPSYYAERPVSVRAVSTQVFRNPNSRPEQLQAALRALKAAQSVGGANFESQLENEVTKTFASAGMTAVQAGRSHPRKSQTPDLALWIDSVQKEIGNPIAVEIKTRLDQANLTKVSRQLSASLESVGATAGIIVHAGPSLNQPDHVVQVAPLIFIFSVDELTQLLEEGDFATVLRTSQNAALGRMF
jgi:hypothetical protein